MPTPKECPLCGEYMRLKEIETVVQVPGNLAAVPRRVREWICPECEHFEEAEPEDRI